MPEHEQQDVPIVEVQVPAETALEKFERERLTRRQALKKFGVTTAMATFAMFSVDDLARMVGKAMQQRVSDSIVAEQVAKEFQQAGIAMATNADPELTSIKCIISGCHDASECNPNKFSWLYCPPCSSFGIKVSGCVGTEIFNCHTGDLNDCLTCCENAYTSCKNSKVTEYNCDTLLKGCENNCGQG